MKTNVIYNKDCLVGMKELPNNSIDLLLTDPPYGISFMGRLWDKAIPSIDIWKESLRVLKPGAFAFVMCIPRQDCLARMVVSLEDAGFNVNFTSIYWAYASGFPKAQNIAKNISKAIDKLKRKMYNSGIWKKNLNDVRSAEKLFLNDLIGVGLLTTLNGSVLEDVQKFYTTRKLNVNVRTAKISSSEVPHILDKNTFIVPQNVVTLPKQKLSSVQTVELKLDDQSQRMSIRIIFVPVDVQTFICEKVESKIKEDVVQRIENGKRKSWNEMDIDALCAEVIGGLKVTTLNQLKNILNYDINYQTELPSATNVIITKSIRECLLIKTANIVGEYQAAHQKGSPNWQGEDRSGGKGSGYKEVAQATLPATPAAQSLDGSYGGFQPKPAVEVIIVAMKPLSEKTYVDQALKNKKGITWLDEGRIPYENEADKGDINRFKGVPMLPPEKGFNQNKVVIDVEVGYKGGRFPANLLCSDDVLNDGRVRDNRRPSETCNSKVTIWGQGKKAIKQRHNDSGSFSRYFSLDAWWEKRLKELPEGVRRTFPFLIVPKASKAEKNRGCEGLPLGSPPASARSKAAPGRQKPLGNKRANYHPTVKPIKLMSYLITLGSRLGDIILDPFIGSGTTAIAAKILKRKYIGFEIDSEYVKIANCRISAVENTLF